MSNRKPARHPAPTHVVHDEPFWAATARGELLIKHCLPCDRSFWYPRPHCPLCGSFDTEWRAASGRGTVYSFSVVADALRPIAAAVIELAEGPRMTTVIVDSDLADLRIDDRVIVCFEAAEDDSMVPVFTTESAQHARSYAEAVLADCEERAAVHEAIAAPITKVTVIGAGSMGTGIVKSFLSNDFAVHLIDADQAALERALSDIQEYLSRLTNKREGWHGPTLTTSLDIDTAAGSQLVVEAVWEDLALKQEIFAKLEAVVSPSCILATNTSTLNINALAASTSHPGRVVGMHFFSPAHVMPLLEIVEGAEIRPETLATAVAVARSIGKTPVIVGVCPGFAANRMMIARNKEAEHLLLEGALPHQVDRVSRAMGLPMGPFEMLDMAGGIEVNVHRRRATGEENWLVDALFERGRLGQKTGRGYYRYKPGERSPIPDQEVTDLILEASLREGIERRSIPDHEVRERLERVLAMEGKALLDEGIVARSGDLDVIWRQGFGWAEWSGGPMYRATSQGWES